MIRAVWWKSTLFWVLLVGAAYLLLGLFGVPPLVKSQLTSTIDSRSKLDPAVKTVTFDPITFTLRFRNMRLKESDKTVLEVEGMTVNFDPLASIYRWEWSFGNVGIDSPRVKVRRGESGVINWSRYRKPQDPSPKRTTSRDTRYYSIDNFRLNKGEIHWSDHSSTPHTDLAFSSIDFTLKNIKWPPSINSTLSLRSEIGKKGILRARGKIMGDTRSINSDIVLSNLPLTYLNDHLRNVIKGKWRSGRLNIRAKLRTSMSPLSLEVTAQGWLDNMLLLNLEGDTVASLEKTTIENVKVHWPKRQFKVGTTKVKKPHVVLKVDEGYRTNLGKLLVAEDESDTPIRKKVTWSGSVGPVRIASANLDFTDVNVPGTFRANVQGLTGSIGEVSTARGDSGTVSLNGQLSNQSTVKIDGSINSFSLASRSNVTMEVENFGLPKLSPYSAKFIGYNIERGKLLLTLNYTSEDGQLSGENHAEIQQLTMGDQVEGAEFSVPVKLAIALLKNRNGVITLDVPVSGDINDPKLDFTKLIRQSVQSAFQSILSSPFSFLAGMIGANPDELKYVEFKPARSQLTERANSGLDKLTRIMDKRPLIKLGIRPSWAETDQLRFARQTLDDYLRDQGNDPDRLSQSVSALETRFTQVSSQDELAEIRQNHTSRQEGSFSDVLDREAYALKLYDLIIDRMEISQDTLRTLAQKRASTIRQTLLVNGIEPDRIFVLNEKQVQSKSSDSVVKLPLTLSGN